MVLVRTAEDPDHLHIKLFKNIVAEDLEMVLPRVRVRMHWLDGLKIGGSLAGSLGTACWKAFTAVLLSPWLFLFVFGTFLIAMLRAFFAYLGSKTRYLQVLSANLYFQNIANNSVLCYLVDAAETKRPRSCCWPMRCCTSSATATGRPKTCGGTPRAGSAGSSAWRSISTRRPSPPNWSKRDWPWSVRRATGRIPPARPNRGSSSRPTICRRCSDG